MEKALLFCFCVLVLLTLVSCRPALKSLTPTGETLEILLTAKRSDSAWVMFPKSEFTRQFSFTLGEGFLNLTDPTWYDRLQIEIEKVYLDERGQDQGRYFRSEIIINSGGASVKTAEAPYWISKVPSVEWLKENTKRGVDKPCLFAWIDNLPIEGDLRRAASKEGVLLLHQEISRGEKKACAYADPSKRQ